MAGKTLADRPSRSRRGGGDADAPRARGRDRVLPVVTIEPLDTFDESKNILLFGDSGCGKTVTAISAPNAVLMSTETGAVAAKIVQRIIKSKTGLMRTPTWPHVEAALDRADRELGPGHWLIADSITKMQILMIRDMLNLAHEENETRSLDIPALQDHQEWQQKFKRFIDRMIDAPYNTIMIATSMEHDDAEGESWMWPQIIGGQGKNHEVCAYVKAQFDVALYMEVEPPEGKADKTNRRITTETIPPVWAKDRYQALPRFIPVKNGDYTVMRRIVRAIDKALAPEKDSDDQA